MITNKQIIILLLIFTVPTVHAVSNADLKWSQGNTYTLTPKDSVVTEKDYTIKAIDFPPPVRGRRTVNDTIAPDNPVTPAVTLELYKDIINNTNPIATFILVPGDEYITEDQELRITIDDIPGSTSQDWVYEYYNPWASIRIQKRAVPSLSIDMSSMDSSGNNMSEESISSEESFKIDITIKNTGEDVLNNVEFKITPDPLLLKSVAITNKLKDSVYRLDAGNEKVVEITLAAPASQEEKEYEINAEAAGYDIKDILYTANASMKIKVKGATESILVNKTTKNTVYLKENVNVILSVVNRAHLTIYDIKAYDSIPDKLSLLKDNIVYENVTEFIFNKSSIEPDQSWTLSYVLKPAEPGVYVLPKFKINYSMGGKEFNSSSDEAGFRVFGPKVILNKSIAREGNDTVEITVTAKNIGNGFTTVKIEDELPRNATLVSGKTNLSTPLDIDAEKALAYTIKIQGQKDITWPQARATYYLDDYKFSTSSDERISFSEQVPAVTPTINPTPAATPPVVEETQKKVVATIPAKAPVQAQEKKFPIPGFRYYESLIGIILITIAGLLARRLKT